jgi:outer membrane protein assembly factor BamB
MRQPALLLAFMLCAAVTRAAEISSVDPALRPLITKLGDDNFDVRESAEKEILALAMDREEVVAPVLKEMLIAEQDPEVRKRLDTLFKKMSAFGAVDWSVEAGQIYQLPAIYNKRIYIGNKDGTLLCYEAATGQVVWKHENGGFISPSLAAADGRVIFIRTRLDGLDDGRVFALDALDGHELWSWQDEKRAQHFTAPIIADGAIYFGRVNELVCLDALQGTLRWKLGVPNSIVAPPSIADGRVIFEQYGGKLECVAAADKKLLWEFALGTHAHAGACIDGGRVFVAGGNTVYRIGLVSGQKLWESRGNDNVSVSLAAKGERVFAAHAMTLRCLDANNGHEIWRKETGGHIFAQPAVVGDRLYAGSLNNKLTMYCLNATDGKELWTHCTEEAGYAEPILAGRRLFMGYHSKFYGLKTGMPGPAAWPMSGGNPGRSGCNDGPP